jgi:two-component system nitrate/nitrite response regulator NarL
MPEPIRVGIVDDHPFFRDGVRRSLRRAREVSIVAEGASADDACRIARDEAPEILLLDVAIPGGGLAAAKAIAASHPEVRIVMLTGSDDEETVATALGAGAMGYVLKGAGLEELLEALRTVHEGRPYVTPALSSRLLVSALRGHRGAEAARPEDGLSRREQEILDRAVEGMTNAEIAGDLGLATPTVKNYMSRIFEKLQVRNRSEAVALRLRHR